MVLVWSNMVIPGLTVGDGLGLIVGDGLGRSIGDGLGRSIGDGLGRSIGNGQGITMRVLQARTTFGPTRLGTPVIVKFSQVL